MLLLGIDIGTSSIKASVVDADTQQVIASAQYPDVEAPISSPFAGWAEQSPEMWWNNTIEAIKRVNALGKHEATRFDSKEIGAIGIAYQMHGLVMVDKDKKVLRPSIIWCDSRAVQIGDKAFSEMGEELCLNHLLNSPGNFTASKLAWVKANEPHIFEQCDKIMLPGDYIAMMLTGEITTSNSGLSEGIFWDFQENSVSKDLLNYYGFDESIIPEIRPVFSEHGKVTQFIADILAIKAGTPVTYKAGDQPNNALSLDVLNPGEIAATAGTSGVVYAVSDQISYDPQSRINSFAHVNHKIDGANRVGILLCINGTGILNRWAKENFGKDLTYPDMNKQAEQVAIGSNGLLVMPFGNGAERILNNRILGASFHNLDFNIHSQAHVFRAAQEGIAFSFNYGLGIMQANGVEPKVIRAGKANMFLSDIFSNALVNVTNTPIELYDTDGAKGAALGAGYGVTYYSTPKEAMSKLIKLKVIEPKSADVMAYQEAYENWKVVLEKLMQG
ncbi:xylulokinase [Emticicia sp. C21]|uniref:xylulokinase n=1 Tax=Emticicia sp. C21 TaxID=2302915 RepID=UPI000E3449DD|nr:FGGY family carbohydrate kinase [Emticicia sp. C21]RFS16232.1 carbohydrate kinase [Emticicia sp. C21]